MSENDFIKLDFYHRRERILDAAASLFSIKGYDATSTIELAETAGCSESMLFCVFRTKADIYDALFEEWQHQVQRAFTIRIINDSAVDTLKRFFNEQISRRFSRNHNMRPNLEGTLYTRLTGKSRRRMYDVLANVPDFVSETIMPIIVFGQENGEIIDGDPAVLACILWRIIWGDKEQSMYRKRQAMTFEMISFIFVKEA